jgi:hypothetical protein
MNRQVDERLLIKKLETDKEKVYKTHMMKSKVLPEHPFRGIISGASGSGKTQLILNLLSNKNYYKDYFDVIFILSPTAGELDDTYDILKPEEEKKDPSTVDIAKELKKKKKETKIYFINNVTPKVIGDIMKTNENLIKKNGVENSPKILLLYDDVVSNKKLMGDEKFHHSFIASRHYNASVFICTQKYNQVPRVCRLQANAIMYFKGTESENKIITEEHCPPGYKRKEFEKILHDATNEKFSFLFINCQDDIRTRYRKCLHSIIVLKKHEAAKTEEDKPKKQETPGDTITKESGDEKSSEMVNEEKQQESS